jgi:hypothetical protein
MPKAPNKADVENQNGEYDPDGLPGLQDDAETLQKAHAIQQDPDRHQKAHDYINQQVEKMQGARDAARKQLHKKVKKGLAKSFGGGNTFQQEQEKEQGQAEQTVNTKE